MARDGSGVYSLPAGSIVGNGQTSDATQHNTPLQDLETDANTARPITAGGTGATTAAGARANLELHQFPTRADFVASSLTDLDDGDVVLAGGDYYERSAGATDISDLTGWIPHGPAFPEHFGAQEIETSATNQATKLQAWIDYVKDNWASTYGHFQNILHGRDRMYYLTVSLDITELRQPGLIMSNIEFYSNGPSVTLDFTGSWTVTLDNVQITGASANPPLVGFLFGRGSGLAAAGRHNFTGRTGTRGYFQFAGIMLVSSEVSNWGGRCSFQNSYRGTNAAAVAMIDHMQACVDQFGSAVTSSYTTLQQVSDGNKSFVCHNMGQLTALRPADYSLTISSITQANPAVVTVGSGEVAANSIANGNTVYISDGDMTEVAYRTFTVANVSGDTFELSGEDSTGHTAYTSGATLQNATGPALFIAGAKSLNITNGYLLTYGAPNIKVNCDNSSTIRDWAINAQFERQPANPVEIVLTSGTSTMPNINFEFPHHSQDTRDEFFKITGSGTASMRFGGVTIVNMGTVPTNGIFNPVAQFNLDGFVINSPSATPLPDPASVGRLSGWVYGQDQSPSRLEIHGATLQSFGHLYPDTSSGALSGTGMRFTSDQVIFYPDAFSGERALQVNTRVTTGQLANVAHVVNTTDKYAGKMVWNITTGRPVYATGSAAADVWNYSDGTTAHSPV